MAYVMSIRLVVVVVVVIGPLAKVSLRYVRFSVDIATPSKISQVCLCCCGAIWWVHSQIE